MLREFVGGREEREKRKRRCGAAGEQEAFKMWAPLSHAVQLVESVPVLLTLSGGAFVALDGLALYQLLKLYGTPCAAAAAGGGRGNSAALLACTARDMYLDSQQQQQELQQQPLVKRVWGKLRSFFTGSSDIAAAAGAYGGGRRSVGGGPAAAHPVVTTTTGGQTRFAFMVLLFLAILGLLVSLLGMSGCMPHGAAGLFAADMGFAVAAARAASLFCMAWIVASRPPLPVVVGGKAADVSVPVAAADVARGAAAAAVDGSSIRAGGLSAAAGGGGRNAASVASESPATSPAAVAGQPAAAVASRAPNNSAAADKLPKGPPGTSAGGEGWSAAAGAPPPSSGSSLPSERGVAGPPPYFNFALDAEWCLLFLDSAPALIFFASLSLIVLFWAKIYYAALLVSYPKLERGHWLFSGGLLALYLLFSLFAVILQAKRSATRALQLFIALLFALAGGAFLVYGLKVLFLSLACPILFGARTLMALRGATPPLHPLLQGSSLFSQPLVIASAIFLLTEWVPAGLILAAFWHRKNRNSSVRSAQQQQLMHRQHHREQRERSFDSASVAAPLMQQPFYPFLAPPPPSYADPRAGAPAGSANCSETVPGENLGQPPVHQQQQPGVTYQSCYPLARGPPSYTLANASYPLQGYYGGQYPPQYYPPPAL